MDEDIRENLKELGAHLRAIANQVASTKSSVQSITAMRECLTDAANTLGTYLDIQKMRYE